MDRVLRPLTPDELAELAAASPTAIAAELARRLGRPYFTVNHALKRIRRAGGWFVPLVWRTCTECGRPVASPRRRPQRRAHVGCRRARDARHSRERRAAGLDRSTPYVRRWREAHAAELAAMRERDKARMRERWPDLPPELQVASLDKVHAADRRDYRRTLDRAERSGADWTGDEDRYVLDHPKTPAREVALALGRTLWAVRNRRVRLRRQR
jgi:hypothetical protein